MDGSEDRHGRVKALLHGMPVRDVLSQLDSLRAEKSRRRLADFVRFSWEVLEPSAKLQWSWHVEVVCDHVQWMFQDWMRSRKDATYFQRAFNLLVNLPPGSLKSRILSVCAPAWVWLHWPSFRFLCLSANPRVAERDGRYCRDLITSRWYQGWFRPKWHVRRDQDAVTNFANTAGGSRVAHGITAKIVGERGDALLVDDPNDVFEANSESARRDVTERWDGGTANRVNDPTSIRIGIQHRVHEEDWSGHVLSKGDMEWVHLCLPTEFDTARRCRTMFGFVDPRDREGDVLHPDRMPTAWIASERMRLGSFGYAGLHQQSPMPKGGGMFRLSWWRWWKPEGKAAGTRARPLGCASREDMPARMVKPSDFQWLAISVDATFKETKSGSRVGLLIVGGIGADRFVVHDSTRRRNFPDTLEAIRVLRGLPVGDLKQPLGVNELVDAVRANISRVLVEDKANGPAIIETLKHAIAGVIAVAPEGGKEARAAAMSPAVEAGNWYLLDGADWVDAGGGDPDDLGFLHEFTLFPNGKHDDRVDAASQLAIHMGKPVGGTAASIVNGAYGRM